MRRGRLEVPERGTRSVLSPAAPAGARLGREAAVAQTSTSTYNGYCVKCREKRDFEGKVEEKNGRRMAKGVCPVCGTKMTRILGKES
ncbi:hypothetical protein LX15_003350 [Streptoalloteichus tenebrarius]|uniref:DUF5679 domain-containing protein n=1 Tax=Streptoalloteichus tenebrarius (strain ATCC 17920 / DSM 40477 / JCM 4838 / CBS 697.72 / NBRC 16177 / NCIMB 11028 / NRRL B-12390 / A12253. 1 / ISP 5477) TaxID=1933 RepID=A0ABT1HVU9_STRSD|nr:hypothetical protein [Streptoalloteichus tenebrarius]